MAYEFDEVLHEAGVLSRTHPNATTTTPITIVVDGEAKQVRLNDAKYLMRGLAAAIARVDASEKAVMAAAEGIGHAVCIGRTNEGMSLPRSRFGDRPLMAGDRPFEATAGKPLLSVLLGGIAADQSVSGRIPDTKG